MLKEVKKSLESHIVLDCDTDIILTVLDQAEDVGLMDDYHSFIITSLVSKKNTSFLIMLRHMQYVRFKKVTNPFIIRYCSFKQWRSQDFSIEGDIKN